MNIETELADGHDAENNYNISKITLSRCLTGVFIHNCNV